MVKLYRKTPKTAIRVRSAVKGNINIINVKKMQVSDGHGAAPLAMTIR
jgi:hypothetical protein